MFLRNSYSSMHGRVTDLSEVRGVRRKDLGIGRPPGVDLISIDMTSVD
jgi:hypothetical protein